MLRNFEDSFYGAQLLANQTITGDGQEHDGASVDLKGCEKGVLLVDVGDVATGATLTYQIQTSSDGSTWTDVLSADQTVTDAGASTLYTHELSDLKRYVRIQYTVTNTHSVNVGFAVVGWHAGRVPVS